MKIDICCIARREFLTIRDWVSYHLDLGFHKIWIYQNDELNDDTMKTILSDFIENDRVEIIYDFAGKHCGNVQIAAYNHFINQYNNTDEYDWVGFIDCDEYFDYNHEKYSSLSDFFCAVEENCPDIAVFRVNWQTYGDCGEYFYKDEPVIDRFPVPLKDGVEFHDDDTENVHIKSFLRNKKQGCFAADPHACRTNNIAYNADFVMVDVNSPFNKTFSYKNAVLKHYVTKSLEEYIFRKMLINHSADGANGCYSLNYYFARNKRTDEVEIALKKICEKYNFSIQV